MKKLVFMLLISVSTCASADEQFVAKGFDLVDGAIVCSSLGLANYLSTRINQARHARLSPPPELRRQVALINGEDPGAEPKPSDYGCAFVPIGTPMTVQKGNYVPVVSGILPNGRPFSGVTIPAMVGH